MPSISNTMQQPVQLSRKDLDILLQAMHRCETRGQRTLTALTVFGMQFQADIEIIAQARTYLQMMADSRDRCQDPGDRRSG